MTRASKKSRMKLRHSAALALVGWYLIAPPPKSRGRQAIDLHAPLGRWLIFHTYETFQDCEDDRKDLVDHAAAYVGAKHIDSPQKNETLAMMKGETLSLAHSRCISTTDPRLKEK
jgi:hypothetical protein